MGKDAFGPLLQRLCLTLEALAIGKSQNQQNDADQAQAQIKDLIETKVITDDDNHARYIAVSNNEGQFCDESGRSLCIMWKADVYLGTLHARS